jgi:hypothetical protein
VENTSLSPFSSPLLLTQYSGLLPLPLLSCLAAEPSGLAEPLLVVPPMFAKSDAPMDYAFKQFKYQAPGAKGG